MTLAAIPAHVAAYGYPALFVACVLEGPVATVAGGFLASLGLLDARLVFAVSVLGDLVGDLIYYSAGRYGFSWGWLQRRIGTRRHVVDAARDAFLRAPGRALLLGKWLHAAGFAVLIAAGAFRMPLAPFLGFNFLGTVPKSALLVIVGYFFGAAYQRFDRALSIASLVIFALMVGGFAWYVRRRGRRSDAHCDLHR